MADPEKHFAFHDQWMRDYYLGAIKSILEIKQIEGKVLDIGSGPGAFGILLCERTEFTSVIGLEQSNTLLRVGEAVSSRYGYTGRISFKIWENDSLPFADNEFDAVVSLSSMHQWKEPAKILADIERVKKKDGLVYISDYRRDQFRLPFYFYARKMRLKFGKEISSNLKNGLRAAYTSEEIRDLLENLNLTQWHLEKNHRWFNLMFPSKTASENLGE